VLAVEDWAEIRRLHRADGVPIKVIARSMEIWKNTVRKALRDDGPPRYESGSAVGRWSMLSSRRSANCSG
jgi:transposase